MRWENQPQIGPKIMPQGFTGIADLKIMVDAETDKLSENLSLAHNLVKQFAAEGSTSLGLFDKAIGLASSGIGGFQARLGAVGVALTAVSGFVDVAKQALGTIAAQTGTEENFAKVESAAAALSATLTNSVNLALEVTSQEASQLANRMLSLDSQVEASTTTANGYAAALQDGLAAALREANFQLQSQAPVAKQSVETLEEVIARAVKQIEALREAAANGGTQELIMNSDGFAQAVGRSTEELIKEADQLENMLPIWGMHVGALKLAAEAEKELANQARHAQEVVDGDKVLERLDKEITGLENKAETLGMTASAAAAYNLELAMRAELDKTELTENAEVVANLQAKMARWTELRGSIDAYGESRKRLATIEGMDNELASLERKTKALGQNVAETAQLAALEKALADLRRQGREASPAEYAVIDEKADAIRVAAAEQASAQQEKASGAAIANMDNEIRSIERRTQAIGLSAGEIARASLVEREFDRIKKSGGEATELQASLIYAKGEAMRDATDAMVEMQKQQAVLRDTGLIVTRSLEGAFAQFTKGATIDWRQMTQSMIADLAQLTFKRGVTDQLASLFTGGGGNSGAGLLSTLFGGFRADGGPVSDGVPYIVGERGPELFVPNGAGTILPNGAELGGGAVHATVNVVIDAKGAYPESIAQIRAAVGELNQSLPGRIVETIRETRERGM
jgi:hypothetical protein